MVQVDENQISRGLTQTESINTNGYTLPTVVPESDVGRLLAGYDPNNIDPAIAQEIARAVLDALQQATS